MTTFIKWITLSDKDLLEYIGSDYDVEDFTREELEDFSQQLYEYGNRGTDAILQAEEDSIKTLKLLPIVMNISTFMDYKTLIALCSSRSAYVDVCRTTYIWLRILHERLGKKLGDLFKNFDRSTLKQVVSALDDNIWNYRKLKEIISEELLLQMFFELEGNLDLNGFLGVSDKERNGFQKIKVNCKIKSDASSETLQQLCDLAQEHSPVFDIITNPVPVSVSMTKME